MHGVSPFLSLPVSLPARVWPPCRRAPPLFSRPRVGKLPRLTAGNLPSCSGAKRLLFALLKMQFILSGSGSNLLAALALGPNVRP